MIPACLLKMLSLCDVMEPGHHCLCNLYIMHYIVKALQQNNFFTVNIRMEVILSHKAASMKTSYSPILCISEMLIEELYLESVEQMLLVLTLLLLLQNLTT